MSIIAEVATSNLKTKYPLSPKKFLKKMVEKFIIFVLSAFIWGGLIWLVGMFLFDYINKSNSYKIWAGIICYLLGFVIQYAIYAWYIKLYIKTYHFEDESDFLTIRKGVFTPAEIHVQYLKMQDVYVDQDLLDRFFGIYDVHISSATYSSGIASHIDGVDKEAAMGLKMLFLDKIKMAGKGGGYMEKNSTQSLSSNESDSTATEEKPTQVAHFSSAITSEAYGLSSEWWISEIAKISLGSVILPYFISFWFFSSLANGTNFLGKHTFFWIWLILVALFYLVKFVYLWLWQMHYKYEFGPEYIYMKTGVLSVTEKNMAYNTVQDVRISQTIVDRMFGVADVIIENASANQSANFNLNNKKQSSGINGIVIEGLSLLNARKIVEEVKSVLINKVGLNKGL